MQGSCSCSPSHQELSWRLRQCNEKDSWACDAQAAADAIARSVAVYYSAHSDAACRHNVHATVHARGRVHAV
jgi:hypothetical protein